MVAAGESQVVEARITALPSPEYGNPLPLGLLGYGMTTVVLSLANAVVGRARLCSRYSKFPRTVVVADGPPRR